MRTLLILLLTPALLWGQAKFATELKDEYGPGEAIPLVVDLSKLPEGAVFKGDVVFDVDTDAKKHELHEFSRTEYGLWGTEGTYDIEFIAVWGVPVPDEPGKWSDFGLIKLSHELSIVGVGPNPDPPDPPDPGPTPTGKFEVVMFYEKSQILSMDREKNAVLTSNKVRESINKMGHTFIQVFEDDVFTEGIDPDYTWASNVAVGKTMPVIVVRSKDTGEVFWKPLPNSPMELMLLLEDWK